jgi:hypothetical protein
VQVDSNANAIRGPPKVLPERNVELADPPGKADPVTVRESVRARSGRVSGPDEDAALTSRDHRDGG